jgi:peroxiredoxin
LQDIYGNLKNIGSEMVVFSAENPDISRALAEKQRIAYPIVTDQGLGIARRFGLVFALPDDLKSVYQSFGIDLPKNTGHPEWELPVPSRFIVDGAGIVWSVEADPDYTVRPEATDTLAKLMSID